MANTTVIQKLENGNILINKDGTEYTLTGDMHVYKDEDNQAVFVKDKASSKIDTYLVSEVEKVIREDGTEVPINDVDVLFVELYTYFFFKVAGSVNPQGSSYLGTITDWDALTAEYPTANFGDFANVENPQGTSWLPWTLGGTYYPQGTYYWDGVKWDTNVEKIAEELENITTKYAEYDGKLATSAEILAMSATTHLGETWWAVDTKLEYKAVSIPSNGDVWQELGVLYKESTDTYCLPSTYDSHNLDLGQESIFPAVNDGLISATALEPKVFISLEAKMGNEELYSIATAIASDITDLSKYGINTTDANTGGLVPTKILRDGRANGVNTSAWSKGDVLYVDSLISGGLTNVVPENNIRPVAVVLVVDAVNGVLDVNTISNTRVDRINSLLVSTNYWFTGEIENVNGADYYKVIPADQGSVPTVTSSVIVNDNQTLPFPDEWIFPELDAPATILKGEYPGFLEFSHNIGGGDEKFTIELYVTDSLGNIEDSGIPGAVIGTKGFETIMIWESPLLPSDPNDNHYTRLNANLSQDFSIAVGKRLLYVVTGEKRGTAGPAKTITIYAGSDHLTFVQSLQKISSDDVTYVTTGETVTEALDSILQKVTVIFEDDFEDGLGNWNLVNGANNPFALITTGAISGAQSLGIDDAGSGAPNYTGNTSINYAYTDIPIPATSTDLTILFNWYCEGENGISPDNYDFGRVFIVETSTTPIAGTLLPANKIVGAVKLNLEPTTQTVELELNPTNIDGVNYTGQDLRLVFCWANDGAVQNQPPIVFDNLVVADGKLEDIGTDYEELNESYGVVSTGVWEPIATVHLNRKLNIIVDNLHTSQQEIGVRKIGSLETRVVDQYDSSITPFDVETDGAGFFEAYVESNNSVVFTVISSENL